MSVWRSSVRWAWITALMALATTAQAAGTVQLELVGDTRGAAMAFQEWAQVLGRAGIRNVRIRAVEESDNVGVQVHGDTDRPVYVVTGIVRSRTELIMPNGSYRPSEVGRLSQWLQDLAERGPEGEKEQTSAEQRKLEQARRNLAAPVEFSSVGMSRAEVARKIVDHLSWPVKVDARTMQVLGDEKCQDELRSLASGTALAYLLRTVRRELRLVDAGNSYEVVERRAQGEEWPVGWPSEKQERETVPGLYEFLNVNVQNVSAATALEAIGKRVKAPVLLDRYAMAKHSIDPSKVLVNLPKSRTTYSLALRKLLFQTRLKFEVRYDEAGTPFLWVTTIKPVD